MGKKKWTMLHKIERPPHRNAKGEILCDWCGGKMKYGQCTVCKRTKTAPFGW